jgi:hypothetical protein
MDIFIAFNASKFAGSLEGLELGICSVRKSKAPTAAVILYKKLVNMSNLGTLTLFDEEDNISGIHPKNPSVFDHSQWYTNG